MNKEDYTTWYEGLKERLATGNFDQQEYERLIISNLQSMITRFFNRRLDFNAPSRESFIELLNHYFELIADAEISANNAAYLVRSVAGCIKDLPAGEAFAKKHNVNVPALRGIIGSRPGLLRKQIGGTIEKMVGQPVITQVNEPGDDLTIALPWKLALHVYRGFLVKHLMSKHDYGFNEAYVYITDHQNKYDELLAEALDGIIAHEESHLVSVGGGITAAGTGLVVSGIIKPEA